MDIIFDLGGVLCTFDWEAFIKIMQASGNAQIDPTKLSALQVELNKGAITIPEFHVAVTAMAGSSMPYEEFIQYLSQYHRNPGVETVVKTIPKNHNLILLSNTNQIHFNNIFKRLPVAPRFDYYYLSYRLGLAKPDPEIFGLYKEDFPNTGKTLFIDDAEENIIAANKAGMTTHHYKTADALRAFLQSQGVLT